ncbi:hypothetical protein ACFMQL_39845 [Nonomuraea fastidiosa]|jgi:hypothetical protein|uniref:hypothetical protein n=2 Tax=Nonomuraea TaxID=83681 RepID=UPI003670BD91
MAARQAPAPPPRWAVRAAHAVALVTLPSGLWRVALVAGLPIGYVADVPPEVRDLPPGEVAYIVGLSVVSELAALLTIGLVKPWGEVPPRWLPLVGGRRMRPRLVLAAAYTGAALIVLLCGYAVLAVILQLGSGFPFLSGAGHALLIACYLPLLAWGPLTFAVAYSYQRRHRHRVTAGRDAS